MKNNKGFTLVELIVVLVILAIMAAVLVPALLGYIDRAKDQKYITEAKELKDAAQAAIVEAYAKDKYGFGKAVRKGPLTKNKTDDASIYGYVSSNWVGQALSGKKIQDNNDDSKGGIFKRIVCEKMVTYYEKKEGMKVSDKTPNFNGNDAKVSAFGGNIAFFIAFNKKGQVFYMQYTNEGKLVTFDGSSFTVEDGGEFINHRN